jgi:hypothetical protein
LASFSYLSDGHFCHIIRLKNIEYLQFFQIKKKGLSATLPIVQQFNFYYAMHFVFRYWPNNKSRLYILETTGMRSS